MEFGSKFVYYYNESDEECVSDEEYSNGITDESNPLDAVQHLEIKSDEPSTSHLAAESSKEKNKKEPPSWTKPVSQPSEGAGAAAVTGEQKWRQADTNVVAVRFEQLTKPSNMHTGDAVSCRRCHAVLSHLSTITDCTAEGEKIWQCEFCDERNVVDISSDEIPTDPDVTYMISPAPATAAASCQGDEGSMVIFCIDVSGSMDGRGCKKRYRAISGQVVQMDYDVGAFNESFEELFNFLNEEIVSSIRHEVEQSQSVRVHFLTEASFQPGADDDNNDNDSRITGYFRTTPVTLTLGESLPDLNAIIAELNNQVEQFTCRGSGFVLDTVTKLAIVFARFRDLN